MTLGVDCYSCDNSSVQQEKSVSFSKMTTAGIELTRPEEEVPGGKPPDEMDRAG